MARLGRRGRGRGRRESRERLLIERVHQDRLDRVVAILPHGMSTGARGFQARGAKALGAAEDALAAAGAIAGARAERRVEGRDAAGARVTRALAAPAPGRTGDEG